MTVNETKCRADILNSPDILLKLCRLYEISIFNMAIQKRAKLQICQQNETFSVLPFTGENVLLFPAPMSQAITNLNYFHHSAVFVDTIFAHLELIVSVY